MQENNKRRINENQYNQSYKGQKTASSNMNLEEFSLQNNDLKFNRFRALDKKKVNQGNQFSSILTEEMKDLMKFKQEENKSLAQKFGESVLQNDIRQVGNNIKQIHWHEQEFIHDSVEKGQFINFANDKQFTRKDMKNNNQTDGDQKKNVKKPKDSPKTESRLSNKMIITKSTKKLEGRGSLRTRPMSKNVTNDSLSKENNAVQDESFHQMNDQLLGVPESPKKLRTISEVDENFQVDQQNIEFARGNMLESSQNLINELEDMKDRDNDHSMFSKKNKLSQSMLTNNSHIPSKTSNRQSSERLKLNTSQDIRLKQTTHYPYQSVVNEDVMNEGLQRVEDEKKREMKMNRNRFKMKNTSVSISKQEPFKNKILRQEHECSSTINELGGKGKWAKSMQFTLKELKGGIQDEFDKMDQVATRPGESLLKLAGHLEVVKKSKLESKQRNQYLQDVGVNN